MIYKEFADRANKVPYERWRTTTYHIEMSRIENDFRIALAKEYGTEGNPKEGKLFCAAWSHGHSGGFSEVENWYLLLSDLIKDENI